MKKKSKTSGQRWKFKKKVYQPRPEVEGQGLMFSEPSDIEKILLARKKKALSLEERQAFRELQAGGLIEAGGPGSDKG